MTNTEKFTERNLHLLIVRSGSCFCCSASAIGVVDNGISVRRPLRPHRLRTRHLLRYPRRSPACKSVSPQRRRMRKRHRPPLYICIWIGVRRSAQVLISYRRIDNWLAHTRNRCRHYVVLVSDRRDPIPVSDASHPCFIAVCANRSVQKRR